MDTLISARRTRKELKKEKKEKIYISILFLAENFFPPLHEISVVVQKGKGTANSFFFFFLLIKIKISSLF